MYMVKAVFKKVRVEVVVISCQCSYSFHFSRKENDIDKLALKLIEKFGDKNTSAFSTQCTERQANACLLQTEEHVTESGSSSLKSMKLLTKYDQHRDYSLGGVLTSGSFILFTVLGKFKQHPLLKIHLVSPLHYVNRHL